MNAVKKLSPTCLLILLLSIPMPSQAHVKWFSEFDLNSPPKPILDILLNIRFAILVAVTCLLIFSIAYIDRYLSNNPNKMNRYINTITQKTEDHLPAFLRTGVCVFMLAIANEGGIILTPELKTSIILISWFQVFLAITALSRRTAFISAIGIILLYCFAAYKYGPFHVLDYPVFLGVAVYILLDSLKGKQARNIAHSILRVSTGITLLWASVEKWAFPEWSFEILFQKPNMAMGLSWDLFMILAGFVEFCAAFLLITGHHSSRVAALVLLFFFVSAIEGYGYIDAVGHSGIIVVLIMLILSHNPVAHRFDVPNSFKQTATLHACWFLAAILAFHVAYYVGYYAEYGLDIV